MEAWEGRVERAYHPWPLGFKRNKTTLHSNNNSIGMFGQVVLAHPKFGPPPLSAS
jgi:hypothetical protein